MIDRHELMITCLGVRVRNAVIGFLLELHDAGFKLSASGSQLFVEPAKDLNEDELDGIAQYGPELARFLVDSEKRKTN